MSDWKSEQIAAERRKKAEVAFAGASRDELLARIVALETALYKIVYPLSELDVDAGPRSSAWMVSKLFPHRYLDKAENEEFCIYDPVAKEFVGEKVIAETMHEVEYVLDDSVSIADGSKLSDDLEIISVHQSAACASIYCGAIYMGDVREAARLLWGQAALPNAKQKAQT